jgi:regulatory protein
MRQPQPAPGAAGNSERPIDAGLVEKWALSYLSRYASTAENLRQFLRRRVRRRFAVENVRDREAAAAAEPLIEALVNRCRETGLVNDEAYAASRARRGVAQGRSLRRIAAGLATKGVGAAEAAAAIAALREEGADPDLAAAIAFARRRRLGPFRRDPRSRDEAGPDGTNRRQVELAAFARAGFPRRAAESILACRDDAAVAALLGGGDPEGAGPITVYPPGSRPRDSTT